MNWQRENHYIRRCGDYAIVRTAEHGGKFVGIHSPTHEMLIQSYDEKAVIETCEAHYASRHAGRTTEGLDEIPNFCEG